ncbi:hypothetical protein [Roseateles puraquae]|jgi:hypothetical protein|uniref:hypothetical protein n=1 Tax=Roseateles puraquae TaxID=431059 RepID=UPI0031D03527
MRITNDKSLSALLSEMFSYSVAGKKETAIFKSEDWSNHDWLLEQLHDRLDAVLNSYKRLHTEVHVTQGLRDQGVDVRLDFEAGVLGFQLKSNREADADAKSAKAGPRDRVTLVGKLKSQAQEAFSVGKVDEWWVLLCFDRAKHAKLVSRICSEVRPGKGQLIKIFEPQNALGFLQLSDAEIDAVSTLILCADDELLVAAREEAVAFSDAALDIIYGTLPDALEGESDISFSALSRFPSKPDREKGVSDAIQELETRGYLSGLFGGGDMFRVSPMAVPAVCALFFEGYVRHGLRHEELIHFVRSLTCIQLRV